MKPYLIIFICFNCLIHSKDANGQGKGNKQLDKVKLLIPPGNEILDVVSGDMNADGFTDYAMVLRNENEDNNGDELRPLLLITGNKSGELTLLQRNDSVVLCKNCGGVFGDPFQQITFKNGMLLIENNIGSNWRWSRNISFKYDSFLQDFVLNDDTSFSYQKYNSNKQTAVLTTADEQSKQLFRNFSFMKNR